MSVCGVYIRMPRLLWESQRLSQICELDQCRESVTLLNHGQSSQV